jgi:hypothetical protein
VRVKDIKRPRRVRGFDREGWPALSKVDYDVHLTEDCAENAQTFWRIAGPYWFGRAFETPPFFTWSATNFEPINQSAPFMTAGVAEWLTDEEGMYLGAMVWFQLGRPFGCVSG